MFFTDMLFVRLGSPNQHLLACGFTRGHVRIFDVAATKTLVEYQQHASAGTSFVN
jgi:hypothetical protein